MSKCPFWSTNRKRVECYDICPMYEASVDNINCMFKANSQSNQLVFKDIIDNDVSYSQDKAFKLDFIDESSVC